MSWECFSRRKKSNADQVPRSRSAPALQTTFAPHSLEGQILAYGLSPTSKTSRIRCLSRIEKVFFTPSPSSQLKSSRAVSNPSRNRSVWCITSYTGAPALEVQLPRPLRPESILVYDSPTDTSVISWESPADQLSNSDHKWPMEVLPPIKRLPKRQAVPARLTLHDPTRPLVQAKQTLRRSLNTPELLRQSQYAVVSEIESFPNQPQISPEPTPRAEVTTFSSKTSLASPVHSSRSDGTSTTSARAHHVSAVRQSRYAELRTPPPTPPPAVPLPPLPTPAVVLPSRSYTMSDVGIALSSDVPICLNSLKPPLEQFYHDPHHLPRRFRSASSPLTFTTHFGPAVSHPRAPLNARRALPPPRSRNDIRQSQCVRATVRHHEKGNHLTGVTRAE